MTLMQYYFTKSFKSAPPSDECVHTTTGYNDWRNILREMEVRKRKPDLLWLPGFYQRHSSHNFTQLAEPVGVRG